MNERQIKIIDFLKMKKTISIDTLCKELSYSRSTIRRDLIALEDIALIARSKGNVTLQTCTSKEKHFLIRNQENLDKKQLITQSALDFLTDGMSVFLDASSTTLQLCPSLSHYKNMTIITNGIEIAHALLPLPNIEVFMAGGYARENSSAIVGEPAIDYLKQFNMDLCILSCTGLDEKGFYEPSLQHSLVKQCVLRQAALNIMLCDSTKFDQKYKFTLAAYHQLNYLITDKKPPEHICQAAFENNCELIYCLKII